MTLVGMELVVVRGVCGRVCVCVVSVVVGISGEGGGFPLLAMGVVGWDCRSWRGVVLFLPFMILWGRGGGFSWRTVSGLLAWNEAKSVCGWGGGNCSVSAMGPPWGGWARATVGDGCVGRVWVGGGWGTLFPVV